MHSTRSLVSAAGVALVAALVVLARCAGSGSDSSATLSAEAIKERAEAFAATVRSGASIQPFLLDTIAFVYHEDNRCDGNTDGMLNPLHSNTIADTLQLQVTNDGDGWIEECARKRDTTYTLSFSLADWLVPWMNQETEFAYIDSMRKVILYAVAPSLSAYFDTAGRIYKLEARDEDPG
jgi:hypothetical protein